LQLLKVIPNSGMAISSDVGDSTNVHPRNKKPVAERLARLALHFTYDEKNIVPYGPLPSSAVKQNNQIVISFQYSNGLKTSDGKALRGFKLMNEKGEQAEVNAFIQNSKVIIPLDKNDAVTEVLYGWEAYTEANLVNEANLPASTFKLKIR